MRIEVNTAVVVLPIESNITNTRASLLIPVPRLLCSVQLDGRNFLTSLTVRDARDKKKTTEINHER